MNQPADEFEEPKEHFIGNLDELCLMACDRTVKVIAAETSGKTDIIMGDCHISIMTICTFCLWYSGSLHISGKGEDNSVEVDHRPSQIVMLYTSRIKSYYDRECASHR